MANPQEVTNELLRENNRLLGLVIQAVQGQMPELLTIISDLKQANAKLSCLHDVHCVEQHDQNYCYRCKGNICTT